MTDLAAGIVEKKKTETIELFPADSPKEVAAIVRETVLAAYPKYYPAGAVQFFLDLHSEEKIQKAMTREEIYIARIQGQTVGTGSVRGNEICRLFILPEYQGRGYGSRLMDLLEARIFKTHTEVYVDASFPAETMYLNRGYQIISYEKIETENGDFLCWHRMVKKAEAACNPQGEGGRHEQ